jgi:hypothetical protein
VLEQPSSSPFFTPASQGNTIDPLLRAFSVTSRKWRASEVSVRTTPFTCGCQASVAINIRMSGPEELVKGLTKPLMMILCSRRSFIDISGV